MRIVSKKYVNGIWDLDHSGSSMQIIDPSTEAAIGELFLANETDVDHAVDAAVKAFEEFGKSNKKTRLELMEKITSVYAQRMPELAEALSQEMGAPVSLAMNAQVPSGLGHFKAAMSVLDGFEFDEENGTSMIVREPIGVVGLITPWNWPLNQICAKVAYALAAGCTMVLKPSELAPINAALFTDILEEAGVPKGVFNLVNGTGAQVGAAITSHPDVSMVSFTGSTRAGIAVSQAAANTVKRVALELGGKSANIILDSADFEEVVTRDTLRMCMNAGQNCVAPSRMLVPESRIDEVAAIATKAANSISIGDPSDSDVQMGPVASREQYDKVQHYIKQGVDEGASLVCGGFGRPEEMDGGFFVRPTVFSNVTSDMSIARDEIFGPVLSIIGYSDEEDAIKIANNSEYGLSAYVSSGDLESAQQMARQLRAGGVYINGAPTDASSPFGGYKKSGNGREFGRWGLEEFLEVKALLGYCPN